jgi:hypothetical protein
MGSAVLPSQPRGQQIPAVLDAYRAQGGVAGQVAAAIAARLVR